MTNFLLCVFLIIELSALSYGHNEFSEEEERRRLYEMPGFNPRSPTTKWSLKSPGIATVSHTGTIFDNNKHNVEGTGYASKNIPLGGIVPEVYGGRVDYSHKQSGSAFGIQADHIRRGGTDVSASGTYNIINQKDAQLGVRAQYERHYGGPGGNGKPDYGVFVDGKVNI